MCLAHTQTSPGVELHTHTLWLRSRSLWFLNIPAHPAGLLPSLSAGHFLSELSLSGLLPSGALDLRLNTSKDDLEAKSADTLVPSRNRCLPPGTLESAFGGSVLVGPQILITEVASLQPRMGARLVTSGHQPFPGSHAGGWTQLPTSPLPTCKMGGQGPPVRPPPLITVACNKASHLPRCGNFPILTVIKIGALIVKTRGRTLQPAHLALPSPVSAL